MEVRFSGELARSDLGKMWDLEVQESIETQVARLLELPQQNDMQDDESDIASEKIKKIMDDLKN